MTFGSLTARAPVGAETPGSVFVQQVERELDFVFRQSDCLATLGNGGERPSTGTAWTSDDRGPYREIPWIASSFEDLEKSSKMLESDRSRRGSGHRRSGRELDVVS
ncbi:hypothetical protein PspLS_07320 [Pyricularia sp. CBS 133598]|nr:hypothetical protein PspLS_07320 [Pyricularia sp. CBS 133598]